MARVSRLPAQDLAQIVRSTGALWEPLRGGNILITGATGFFGRWLLESLEALNRELGLDLRVIAQSRDPAAFLQRAPHLGPESGIRWWRSHPSALTAAALREATGAGGLAAIVHLVTEADNAALVARPDLAEETIVGSTRTALDLARQTGARHLLFTSSGSVYAAGNGAGPARLPEDHPLVGLSGARDSGHAIGGICKHRAEELCVAAAESSGLHATIARCFTFAGPGMPLRGKFALGNFLDDALHGRDIVIQGDGQAVRSYLYAADLAVWLWTIMRRGAAGRAYNVGSEAAVTIREAADTVRDNLAPQAPVRVLGAGGAGATRYVPDTRRARNELPLCETVALPEAVRRTASWLRQYERR